MKLRGFKEDGNNNLREKGYHRDKLKNDGDKILKNLNNISIVPTL